MDRCCRRRKKHDHCKNHDKKDEKDKKIGHRTRSELFALIDGGAVRFDGEDDEQVIWQDVASLVVVGKRHAPVYHDISGSIHVTFEDSDDTPAVADFLLRLIDPGGHVLCTQRVRYAAAVVEVGDTEVITPFIMKCVTELERNGVTHYRLQADLLDERLAKNNTVYLEDIDWAAIVWGPQD